MASFTEEEELAFLKRHCKNAIDQGTTLAEFTAEFLTFPESFKDEVLQAMQAEMDKMDQYSTTVLDKKGNIADVKERLENA